MAAGTEYALREKKGGLFHFSDTIASSIDRSLSSFELTVLLYITSIIIIFDLLSVVLH